MPEKNFYQTFYQTDLLFRLADESWSVAETVSDETDAPNALLGAAADTDLLTELDALVTVETQLIDTVDDVPVFSAPELLPADPEPLVIVSAPELLPQPAPRPTMPSILPPAQQRSRMPQLNHKVLAAGRRSIRPQ